MNEPRRGKCSRRSSQIGTTQENINILSVPNSCCIHTGDPSGDGGAAHDRISNARLLQRGRGTAETITNGFHGTHHPFKNSWTE
jgi:hypothetical protein